MPVAVLSAKGQIVLPKAIREAMGLRKGDRLQLKLEGNCLILERGLPCYPREWRQWRGRLHGGQALDELLKEHAEEVDNERLS